MVGVSESKTQPGEDEPTPFESVYRRSRAKGAGNLRWRDVACGEKTLHLSAVKKTETMIHRSNRDHRTVVTLIARDAARDHAARDHERALAKRRTSAVQELLKRLEVLRGFGTRERR